MEETGKVVAEIICFGGVFSVAVIGIFFHVFQKIENRSRRLK